MVQFSLSPVRLFATPWTAALQSSLSITNSRELAQTHVHWVSDAMQPSHPLLSLSSPAFNLSQSQGLFQWVSSLHQLTKVMYIPQPGSPRRGRREGVGVRVASNSRLRGWREQGAKESQIRFLSYKEALRRVTDIELKGLKDGFRRTCRLSYYMGQHCFIREVLGDGVPPKVTEW